MSPQPLRIRILRALELAPMTVRDLARCLCASRRAVWVALQSVDADRMRRPGRRAGHPEHLYRVAA